MRPIHLHCAGLCFFALVGAEADTTQIHAQFVPKSAALDVTHSGLSFRSTKRGVVLVDQPEAAGLEPRIRDGQAGKAINAEGPGYANSYGDKFSSVLLNWVFWIYIILAVNAAIIYKQCLKPVPLSDVSYLPRDGFSDDLWSLSSSFPICVSSCCCPCIRWSHTTSLLEWHYFYLAVAAWLMFAIIDIFLMACGIQSGGVICFICITVMGIYYRRKMRRHFTLPTTCTSIFQDVLAWCCCMPCAIAQEARHVERSLGSKFSFRAAHPPTLQMDD